MKSTQLNLPHEWEKLVSPEYKLEDLDAIAKRLLSTSDKGVDIYPPSADVFKAFELTKPEDVKVVILGQDPYHGEEQAHGLSFSVPEGVKLPPSLRNIFKELEDDCNLESPRSGNLMAWAKQGVLLLNACLSVEAGKAASHKDWGWQEFTDAVLKSLNSNFDNIVYILWGAYAQKKAKFIDEEKNLVICSPHPSPLSSYRGFFGSKPFSKSNKYLKSVGRETLNWGLKD